jgi:hypothetical protein
MAKDTRAGQRRRLQNSFLSLPHHNSAVLLRLEQQHRARQRTRNPRQRHCRPFPQSLSQVHVSGAVLFLH